MKKILLIFLLVLSAKGTTLLADDLNLKDKKLSQEFTTGKNFEKIQVENSDLVIKGKDNGVVTNELKISGKSNVTVRYENKSENNRGLTLFLKKNDPTDQNIIVGKGSTLNIESYAMKNLDSFKSPFGYGDGFGWLEDKRLTRGLYIKSEYDNQNIGIAGTLNIKSTSFGLDTFYGKNNKGIEDHNVYRTNLDKKLNINFLPGSRINIVAGFTGIFLGTKNQEINFLKGSVSKIQAGDFGIHVSSREYSFSGKPTLYFQNGSSIEVSANWAIKLRDGFIKLDKDTDDKDAPRVKVFGKRVAFRDLNFRVKDGVETDYGKMYLQATGHDLFEKVSGNLELVEGSVIEGNISKSENFSLKLKKGTKFYADEVLELGKMELKGDLFVGSKASYNNMDGYAGASDMTARVSKLSDEDIKNIESNEALLSELDGVGGASYLMLNNIKKDRAELIKEIKYIHKGLKEGKIHVHNKDDYNELQLKKGTFLFKDGTIHLRVGKEGTLAETNRKTNHDTLKFKNTINEFDLQGSLKLHPVKEKEIRRNEKYENILTFEKPIVAYVKVGTDLEKARKEISNRFKIPETDIGAYVLEGKKDPLSNIVLLKYTSKEKLNDKMIDRAYYDYLGKMFVERSDLLKNAGLEYRELSPEEAEKLPVRKLNEKVNGKYVNLKVKAGTDLGGQTEDEYIESVVKRLDRSYREKSDLNYLYKENPNPKHADALKKKEFKENYELDPQYAAEKLHNKKIDEQIKNNKFKYNPYGISLYFTGRLSKAAKKELANSLNKHKASLYTVNTIADAIFENRNMEVLKSKNAWVIGNTKIFRNKETDTKVKETVTVAGYDVTNSQNQSFGFFVGKTSGDYEGLNYGLYFNQKYSSVFLARFHSKYKKSKYNELHAGIVLGNVYPITDKVYFQPSLKNIVIHKGGNEYSTDKMDVKIVKDKSLYSEAAMKLGYKTDFVNSYIKYSVGKNFRNEYEVRFNDDLERKIRGEKLNQNIAIGTDFILGSSIRIQLQANKEISDKYKSNIGFKLGCQYIF